MKVPRWTPANPAATETRRAWAKAMVAHITDPTTTPAGLPAYGSPNWAALADDDPHKLAAAVIAAECWATDQDELPDRLCDELANQREAFEAAWEAHWAFLFADAVNVARAAARPAAFTLRAHYATPQAARIADARRPRPGDYSSQEANQHPDAAQDGEAAA
ncbi:DUF2742 domain-containing protein [Kribbella pratensis]|uniref:Uncharacterized protein DUF2742 n=1 Tax=Kribbella pratensis TaxID=2512112 RepID=A0A4R8BVT5_9ACTN|nr:DUF2742 domain-containing protein [Kribbella pratensis]TDW65616.1 uncharacterized protein DUF2742 [Kribbella pratensis]